MTTTESDIRRSYPLPAYNFRVTIDDVDAAFTEVSGLSIGYATTSYAESRTSGDGPGPVSMLMPGQGTTTTLVLRKGLVALTSVRDLYAWIGTVQTNVVAKKSVHIRLCDNTGATAISWTVREAFPVQLDLPTLDASTSDVAIETLTLVADSVSLDPA